MRIIHEMTLDVSRQGVQASVPLTQNDTGMHSILIHLRNGAKGLKLHEQMTATLYIDNDSYEDAIIYTDNGSYPNTIECYVTPNMTSKTGEYNATLKIFEDADRMFSAPEFIICVKENKATNSNVQTSEPFAAVIKAQVAAEAAAREAENIVQNATEEAKQEITNFIGTVGITQETGQSTASVMSQKAVTDMLLERIPRATILPNTKYISIDTKPDGTSSEEGEITFPKETLFVFGDRYLSLAEDTTIPLSTFSNFIFFKKTGLTGDYNREVVGSFVKIPYYSLYAQDLKNHFYVCAVGKSFAGGTYKRFCDLSVPYYLDGVLINCGESDDGELEKTIPTTFCPMSPPPYIFTGHPFPSIDSTTKIVTFKEGTTMVDRRLPYHGSWEISATVHTKSLTCDMSSVAGTTGIRVCYNISSNQLVARGGTEDIDWSDNLLLLCYNTDSKAAFSSVPVIVDGKLHSANSPIEWSNNSSTSKVYDNLSYCALVPSDGFTGHPFPSIDSTTKIVTFNKGTSVIDPRLPYMGTGSFGYHVPETCDMSEVTSSTSVCVYYNISTKTLIPKAYNTVVDWNDNLLVLSYNTETKTAVSSMPVVVDGKLYCASDALTLDFGGKEDPIDNTKPKEFAELFYNKDKVEPFIFFTDPHLCMFSGDGWRTGFDSYMSTLKRFYDESAVTRVFCGGDWIDGDITDAKDACYRLGLADAKMREYFKEYYPIRGNHESNHDWVANYPVLSRDTIRNLMFRKEGKTYYTADGDNSKFYIFDTQDESDSLYDISYETEQKIWFAESLKNNTAENIILMMHRFYISTVGEAALLSFAIQIMNIAKAFNDRSSISVNGVTYDFSDAVGRVRCLLAGHSHSDHVTRLGDVPVVLTTHFRDGNQPTFDMCLADYDNNKLHLVRVGTGESRTVNI